MDAKGISHYVPYGWRHLIFKVKGGPKFYYQCAETNESSKVLTLNEKRKALVHSIADIIRQGAIDRYKEMGISIDKDKGMVMRHISRFYPRKKMQYVYAVLKAYVGVRI